ncbi:MAG TPA: serine/threonine protein kinase [Rhodothermales bacterium]|nr:serine/threonine protein kinase [Rhodothermales bacterium]
METDPDRWTRIAGVFDSVVDLAPAELDDALGRLCRTPDGQPAPLLRSEVESLIAADRAAATEPAFEVADAAALLDASTPAPGERVGPWRVIREIGRGGMGRVDLVERADGAYEQQAALKRLGLVAPSRVRRFLRERQILASLRHPGIARLLDGGVEEGAPYLVMEYAEGEPITTYADRHGLRLRDRLALVVEVCDAVAYAHQRLVVHRDLKPSNVIVGAREDGRVRATLLDFGVARLLDPDVQDPITAEGPGAPLTPGYAAPEQIDGGEVTTATDVWSLGVLLYELVTGRLPFPTHSRDAWVEAARLAAPTLPSEVVKTASTTGTETPPADARRIRGDLDAICLTALRSEPGDRYASAVELRADVQRFLDGLPVEARRPSAWYRVRRFAGRHKAAVGVALVALALVAGGTAFYTARLSAERDRAETALAEAEATATFLEDVLGAASPFATDRRDTLRVVDLLGEAAREVGTLNNPARQAHLYTVIGRTFDDLGRAVEADSLLRLAARLAAPGTERWNSAAAALGSVLVKGDSAQIAEAVGLFRRVHEGRQRGLPPTDPDLADATADLAFGLMRAGDFEEAEVLAGRSVELYRKAAPPDSIGLAYALMVHGDALEATQQMPEAEAVLREMLDVRRAVYGPDHPSVPVGLSSLAGLLRNQERFGEALPYAEEAHAVSRAVLGADHPNTLDHAVLVASIQRGRGYPEEAVGVIEDVIERLTRTQGPQYPFMPYYYDQHARALMAAERYGQAADALERGLASARAVHGTPAVEAANIVVKLAYLAAQRQDARTAARLYRAGADEFEAVFGTSANAFSAGALNGLGQALVELGREQDALDAFRESLGGYEAAYPPENPTAGLIRERISAIES